MGLTLTRERSWLRFNHRVLRQTERPDVPLLERVRFLAIFANNLDEFFSARLQDRHEQARRAAPDSPELREYRTLLTEAAAYSIEAAGRYHVLRVELAQAGIFLVDPRDLTRDEEDYFGAYLAERVAPLTDISGPEGLSDLSSRAVYLVAGNPHQHRDRPRFTIRLPHGTNRLLEIPGRPNHFLRLEALIQSRTDLFFPEPLAAYALRVTRLADLDIGTDLDWEDLAHALEARLDRPALRLEVESGFPWTAAVRDAAGLLPEEVVELAPPLDHRFLFGLTSLAREDLLYTPVPRHRPRRFMADPLGRVQKRDLLLYHPVDDYEGVTRFLEAAARDPEVDQIRMTMYRIGRGNRLAQLLTEAAEAGKDVAVFLEGRARFDELDNLYWKLRFQAAGVRLLPYPPRKVHAKAIYLRRAGRGLVHLGTGNYNPTNGGLYTDFSLFTAEPSLVEDTLEFFTALEEERLPDLRVMRYGEDGRDLMVENIRAEAHEGGHVILKVNHLTDERVLAALAATAEAGARVDLIVRSSLTTLHERFGARSLIGRYLEHARVAAFRNGGDWRVWAGSADWMPRNFERRLELLFPLLDHRSRERALRVLQQQLDDDRNAFLLLPDGSHRPLWGGELDSQVQWR
ncbi:MAG TPA: hypothetical protein VNT60_11630 [Deinococcales bacterium]|nr:hypothetical protein [Deinococcales bacterium]